MSTERGAHASVVVNGKLYVIGGFAGGDMDQDFLSSVECLDLETQQWSAVAPMSTERDEVAAAVLGGKIFVTGGIASISEGALCSAESFDPGG